MDDQAPEAVESVEERLAARYSQQEQPEEPQEQPQQQEAPEEAQEEAPEVKEATEQEDILSPEQLAHYKVKVKIDGEEKEIPLEEARLGYMRQEDYSRKTQELAKQRDELPKKVKEEVQKHAQEYQQNVRMFYQAVATLADSELVNTDWNKLAVEDPAEFVKRTHRKTQFENVLKAAQQEIKKHEEAIQQERQEAIAQAIAQAKEELPKAIPNWSNDLYVKVLKSGMDHYGFTKEEVEGVVDHRMIKVLHDAMQFRSLKDKKSLVDKKVAEVPKVLTPGTQQSKSLVNSEREKELKKAVRKSGGSMDAMAELLRFRYENRR